MGQREERANADQLRVEVGKLEMEVEQLRAAAREALHLGIGGDHSGAGRVLLAALVGPTPMAAAIAAEKDGST